MAQTQVKLYNMAGKVVGEQKLSSALFSVTPKSDVIHQVVVAQQANARVAIAHTKTKGEVRGGGRKPWKQKGTGRARQGSIRNPQWRGGGIVFGPRSDRNFSLKVNKRMKRTALAMVLSDKVASDKLIVVDEITMTAGKTKQLKAMMLNLPCAKSKTLLSLGVMDTNVIRSAQNIPTTYFVAPDSLNVVDLLNSQFVVVDQAGLKKIEQTFAK